MWLLINLPCPAGNKSRPPAPEISQVVIEDPDAAPVMFKVQATLTEFNAVSIVVPAQVTTSQVVGLLKQFKQARLIRIFRPCSRPRALVFQTRRPGSRRPLHFSDPAHATPDVVGTLARGAHAPGNLYPRRFLSKKRWNRCAAITASI